MYKEHPQAHILRAIAAGKPVEMSYRGGPWKLEGIPSVLSLLGSVGCEVRVAPETLSVTIPYPAGISGILLTKTHAAIVLKFADAEVADTAHRAFLQASIARGLP